MLSTIERAAIRRVVAGGTQSTNRAFQSIWHLQHVATSHIPRSGSVGRSYATATKAAPKPKTTKPTTTKSKTAKPKAAANKVAKKPAKKVARKKAVKKAKPKTRKPVKKILTEEQAKKVAVKDLKAKALSPPKQKPSTAWSVLVSEYVKEHAAAGSGSGMKEASSKYKILSPTELEVNRYILLFDFANKRSVVQPHRQPEQSCERTCSQAVD